MLIHDIPCDPEQEDGFEEIELHMGGDEDEGEANLCVCPRVGRTERLYVYMEKPNGESVSSSVHKEAFVAMCVAALSQLDPSKLRRKAE